MNTHTCYFRRLINASVLGLLFALAFNSIGQRGTSQVIVQFKPDQDDAKIQEVIGKHRAKIKKHVHTVPMKAKGDPGLIVIETSEPAEQAAENLKEEPAVEFAEPDWIQRHQIESDVDPSAVANDPYYTAGYLWGLIDSGTNSFGTRVSTAWAAGHTGTNSVYIGVIDEGVQWQHADLAANVWNNPFDPIDGVDNDGNGYVDDAHGWDFYSWDNSVYDAGGDYHGTHVSGTIAAAGGNGAGVVGVNWRATIISGKFLGTEGGYTSDAIAAIDYFVDLKERHGLNIVALNNSWGGGGYSQALHDAVLRAAKAGILFVAAAGNGDAYGNGLNNDVAASYPSNYDTTRGTSTESKASYNAVIAVAAIDRNGALATFSNYGSRTVHIGAPGVQILSTVPGGYNYMDGTSMATPHVTGAAALYASTHPGATANTIRQALLQSAIPTTSLTAKTSTSSRLTLSQIIGPASTSTGTLAAHLQSSQVTNQQFHVKLEGAVGQRYDIQVSPDLANWTTFSTVTNTTGTMDIADALSVSWPKKFYRAIAH